MKCVSTENAVGHVLCHDITQILPGVKKGVLFKKGHIVKEEDIPLLLSVGKENLYVWEKTEGMLHEDEAAYILKDICMGQDKSMSFTEPQEGKIEILADCDGLLKIDSKKLLEINSLGQMMIATRHTNSVVHRGDKLAGTRIIPLVIEKEKMEKAQSLSGSQPLLKILPFKKMKVSLVTTGSEIKKGLIKDSFGPVLKEKLSFFGASVIGQVFPGDDSEAITKEILNFAKEDADMIICSGGMSVDPDDKTPAAIKASGAEIITYGAPVLPGAMLLLSYLKTEKKEIPLLGLPGCVMYNKRTVFDLLLPRIIAGEKLTEYDINVLGEGGLCLSCPECHFPNCAFGKGEML